MKEDSSLAGQELEGKGQLLSTPAPSRLLALVLAGLAVFLPLWLLNLASPVNAFDQGGWRGFVDARQVGFSPWVIAFTQSFNTMPMVAYVLVAVGFFCFYYRSFWPLLTLGGTMIISPLTVSLIKNLTDRPRPPLDLRLVEEHTFSFPSGHATSTAAFCLALALTAYPALSRGGRWLAFFLLGLLALAVAASRLYVGVHWGTDVIAGLALGSALAALVHLLVWRFYPARRGGPSPAGPAAGA